MRGFKKNEKRAGGSGVYLRSFFAGGVGGGGVAERQSFSDIV